METVNKELVPVERADSKGLLENYYFGVYTGKGYPVGYKPAFSIERAIFVIRNEPMVRAAIRAVVDKAMENGYRFEGSNKKELDRFKKKWSEIRGEKRILRDGMSMLIPFGNVYVEIIGSSPSALGSNLTATPVNDISAPLPTSKKEFKDLNLLEQKYVWIKSDPHGNLIGYEQYVPDPTFGTQKVEDPGSGNRPFWSPEEVTHIKLDNFTVNLWGEVDIQTLYQTCVIKDFVRQFKDWLFRTNQFRNYFRLSQGAAQQAVVDFISDMKGQENDVTKPIVVQTDSLEVGVIRDLKDLEQIDKTMEWCDNQILATLGVPPAAVGKMDTSGRSNSDMQENSRLASRAKALQATFEEAFNNDLNRKCGFQSVTLKFNTLDMKTVNDIMVNAGKMKTELGLKPEVIKSFMEQWGMNFGEVKDIFDPLADTKKSQDAFPSRAGNNGRPNQKQDKPTTRPDQLVSRSEPTPEQPIVEKFSKYPYIIEQ